MIKLPFSIGLVAKNPSPVRDLPTRYGLRFEILGIADIEAIKTGHAIANELDAAPSVAKSGLRESLLAANRRSKRVKTEIFFAISQFAGRLIFTRGS